MSKTGRTKFCLIANPWQRNVFNSYDNERQLTWHAFLCTTPVLCLTPALRPMLQEVVELPWLQQPCRTAWIKLSKALKYIQSQGGGVQLGFSWRCASHKSRDFTARCFGTWQWRFVQIVCCCFCASLYTRWFKPGAPRVIHVNTPDVAIDQGPTSRPWDVARASLCLLQTSSSNLIKDMINSENLLLSNLHLIV